MAFAAIAAGRDFLMPVTMAMLLFFGLLFAALAAKPNPAIKPGALLLLPAAARFDDEFLAPHSRHTERTDSSASAPTPPKMSKAAAIRAALRSARRSASGTPAQRVGEDICSRTQPGPGRRGLGDP